MVSSNPLFHGRWTAKKFGATVIDDIWQEVTVFTLFATRTIHLNSYTVWTDRSTVVVLISEKTEVKLGVSNQLLTVLGLVLGLVISFRTSSAYERQTTFFFFPFPYILPQYRYQEGRKMWTTIMVASRNLAQMAIIIILAHIMLDSEHSYDRFGSMFQSTEARLLGLNPRQLLWRMSSKRRQ